MALTIFARWRSMLALSHAPRTSQFFAVTGLPSRSV